jgi:hypothetical protein
MRKILSAILVAGLLMPAQPRAQIIVEDPSAISQLIVGINNQLTMIRQFADQLNQLMYQTDLATIAGTMLGESVDPNMTALANNLQNTYAAVSRAHNSIMREPGNIEAELALYQNLDQLSFPQLVARARMLQRRVAGTSSASLANSANNIELRSIIADQQARANGMADRSVSALSATQAVAQQLRTASLQLELIERNSASIDANIAQQQAQQEMEREAIEVIAQRDQAAMQAMIGAGASRPQHNPITIGR